jgi:hypothetical protein
MKNERYESYWLRNIDLPARCQECGKDLGEDDFVIVDLCSGDEYWHEDCFAKRIREFKVFVNVTKIVRVAVYTEARSADEAKQNAAASDCYCEDDTGYPHEIILREPETVEEVE